MYDHIARLHLGMLHQQHLGRIVMTVGEDAWLGRHLIQSTRHHDGHALPFAIRNFRSRRPFSSPSVAYRDGLIASARNALVVVLRSQALQQSHRLEIG